MDKQGNADRCRRGSAKLCRLTGILPLAVCAVPKQQFVDSALLVTGADGLEVGFPDAALAERSCREPAPGLSDNNLGS